MKSSLKNMLSLAVVMFMLSGPMTQADSHSESYGFRLAPRDPTYDLVPQTNASHLQTRLRCRTPAQCLRLVVMAKRALANLPAGTVFDELASSTSSDDGKR
jgi:hypothetical protein